MAGTAPHRNEYGLTTRELQVLRLIMEGNTSREVATALGIAFKTASSHRTNIMEKMDVHEKASLVRKALTAGLDR